MNIFQCWFGPLSFSLKFEDKCWGRLWLMVIFIISISILGWSPELQFKVWGRSDQWLLRYSALRILRSSSVGIHLHFEQLSILVLSSKLKFEIWGWSVQSLLRYKFELRSNQPVLRYSTFSILGSSSIGGHLHYEQLASLVLSSKLKFKIWGWLVQLLLRYKFLFGMPR